MKPDTDPNELKKEEKQDSQATPTPTSWWQSGINSISSAGSYIGNTVSSAASAAISGASSVFSSIGSAVNASANAARETIHIVSPFAAAMNNLEEAKNAASAPATQLMQVVQTDLPKMAQHLNDSLSGRPRRVQHEQKHFLSESIATQITFSIPRNIEMHQRQARRQQAREGLGRSVHSIRGRLLLSIQQLQSLQRHLQSFSSNIRLGKDRLNAKIALGEKIGDLLNRLQSLIPGLNDQNIEAVLNSFENFSGNLGQANANLEQFNRMLQQTINLLQDEEAGQTLTGIVERLHQVSLLTDTVDAFAEAASQYQCYAFLRRWGATLSISSSVILSNQAGSYWRSLFILGEAQEFTPTGLIPYLGYLNLAMAGTSAMTGIQSLNRLSLRQMRVDFDYISGLMNQAVSAQFSAAIQRTLAALQTNSSWTPESLAARSRLYHFTLRNLLDQDINLQELMQNVFLNLTIGAIERQTQRLTRPLGGVIGSLSLALLMPFAGYQEAASRICDSNESDFHLYTLYRLLSQMFDYTLGLNRLELENGSENFCEHHYLFEYQMIAPLLYMIEMAAYNQVLGRTLLPYLASQYARCQAQDMLQTWNANDRLANQIREIIESSLRQAMFNENEQPLPAQQGSQFNTSTLLEGLVGVGTQQLVQGLHQAFDNLGYTHFHNPSISSPPQPLNRVQRGFGQSVNVVASLSANLSSRLSSSIHRLIDHRRSQGANQDEEKKEIIKGHKHER